MTKRSAAFLAVPALVLGASLFAAGTASATDNGTGGCRKPPEYKDGLTISTCITRTGPGTAYGNVRTTGTNRSTINLCVWLVDVNQNTVPGSRDCRIVAGADGSVLTPTMSLAPGRYYAVSSFTSPTYYYGGESPSLLMP